MTMTSDTIAEASELLEAPVLHEAATDQSASSSSNGDASPKVRVLKAKPGVTKESALAAAKKENREAKDDEEEEERPTKGEGLSKEMLALKTADHLAVKDWLQQLAAQASVQIAVHRREPKYFTDPKSGIEKKCDGLVSKYDRVIDEEEIQRRHGGGTYQLIVKVKNAKGLWQYFNAKTIEIAGDPRLDDVPRAFVPPPTQASAPTHDPTTQTIVGKAFDMMERSMARDSQRNAHGSTSAADIMAAVNAAIAPLQVTIETLKSTIDARDREIAMMREQMGKGDPFKDQLLGKMLDTENARIAAIRMQHESEIRMLKEQAIAQENRIRDQHQRDIERMERSHEREISSLKQSFETQKAALETASSTQKLVLDSELKRLERDLSTKETELAQLRAKKEQSLKDKVEELKGVKDLLSGDDDDDDDDKSTIVKVIEAAGQLPVVGALAEKLAGGGAAPQQQVALPQAPQQPRRPRLVRDKRTGAVLAPGPDGQLHQVKRVVAPPESNPQAVVPPVDPATIKMALEYMENAFRAGTEPEAFAESARPMIPESVLGAIRALGIDEFMVKVAQLPGTSPLATQSGRNWRRKVAAKLLGEVDE